jgi:hypothetical protein
MTHNEPEQALTECISEPAIEQRHGLLPLPHHLIDVKLATTRLQMDSQ